MLGKVNVNRHTQPQQNPQLQQQHNVPSMQSTTLNPALQPNQSSQTTLAGDNYEIPTMDSNELLSWSLDLMLDDIPPFPDNGFGGDQWLSWNSFNTPNGQSQS